MPSLTQRALDELALTSVIASSFDVKLLCAQRFVRMFAFGSAALILALHLEQLGYSDQLVGLFMMLTMLGDVLISLTLTLFADKLGRKNILVVGSLLVTVSGVVFAVSDDFFLLLAAAIFGVISPSGNEVGPFRAIEESILSSMAPEHIENSRSDLFAWYTLIGTLGSALGTVSAGGIIHLLMHNYHKSELESYRALFYLYAALGIIKSIFAFMMTQRIEVGGPKAIAQLKRGRPRRIVVSDANNPDEGERRPLIYNEHGRNNPRKDKLTTRRPRDRTPDGNPLATDTHPQGRETAPLPPGRSLLPSVSAESRKHLSKLLPLFALDSFASGLVPLSWLSPFFHDKYALSHSSLGALFFSTNLIAAASNIVSASIVRRAGLVYTMVWTHLPNNVFLALIPFPSPQLVWLSITFLALRSATATMDTAPRQAFLTTLLDPAERTAVMGFINVVRTIFQAAGPYASGVLKAEGLLWVSFVMAGGLKVCYDLGILVGFWDYRHWIGERGRPLEEEVGGNGNGDEERAGAAKGGPDEERAADANDEGGKRKGKGKDENEHAPIQLVDDEAGPSSEASKLLSPRARR